MRAHQCITKIKEDYDYKFNDLKQPELEEIVNEILMELKLERKIVPKIVDITSRLGFTVYDYPFKKEKFENAEAMLGVGIEFNVNENSNFFFIEKDETEATRRFYIAYLLAHYIINIDERSTDFYKFVYYRKNMNVDNTFRLTLSLLMPEDIFRAEHELLKITYQINEITYDSQTLISSLSKVFRVSTEMVKTRFKILGIKC